MSASDRMTEDSFEKARAAFFGTPIATPLQNESPAECPKTQKDGSREDGRAKA